jgi:phage terminase large subunit-like protein
MLGNVHREIIQWWNRQDARHHQMLILPRDHMKSTLIAYRIAWKLTKDPALRILLISSTSNLATKQLKFIKDILCSSTYRAYWPEMIHKEEAKREKWTEREISVDHPKRAEEAIRDPSIFTAGLTSNIVGLHCDIAVLDDVVVVTNAYTEEGREKVKEQYGYLSSIETVNAEEWVVGTRYHPKDLYSDLMAMEIEDYDEYGNLSKSTPLFEVFNGDDQRKIQVESVGDGSGEYLWPRQQSKIGKWYGFDWSVLNIKKSQYVNQTHYRAQYYNDPHDEASSSYKRDYFQYYDSNHIHRRDGRWYFKNERINIFAAVDFAYSLGKRSDYTSIVVVGVDGHGNYYLLDIDRFKTDKNIEYFNHISKLYEKWNFRKIRAEVTAAQITIVNDIKDHIRRLGLAMSVDEFKPSKWLGAKEERINAVLQHKYENKQMWHYQGGNCQILEEELTLTNPAHDDIKDALAAAVDLAVAPTGFLQLYQARPQFEYHSKWGGVA